MVSHTAKQYTLDVYVEVWYIGRGGGGGGGEGRGKEGRGRGEEERGRGEEGRKEEGRAECRRKGVTRHWYIHSRLFSHILLYMYTNNHRHTIWYEAIRKGTHIFQELREP